MRNNKKLFLSIAEFILKNYAASRRFHPYYLKNLVNIWHEEALGYSTEYESASRLIENFFSRADDTSTGFLERLKNKYAGLLIAGLNSRRQESFPEIGKNLEQAVIRRMEETSRGLDSGSGVIETTKSIFYIVRQTSLFLQAVVMPFDAKLPLSALREIYNSATALELYGAGDGEIIRLVAEKISALSRAAENSEEPASAGTVRCYLSEQLADIDLADLKKALEDRERDFSRQNAELHIKSGFLKKFHSARRGTVKARAVQDASGEYRTRIINDLEGNEEKLLMLFLEELEGSEHTRLHQDYLRLLGKTRHSYKEKILKWSGILFIVKKMAVDFEYQLVKYLEIFDLAGVVSGFPKNTPTCILIWLMKIIKVFVLSAMAVSFLKA